MTISTSPIMAPMPSPAAAQSSAAGKAQAGLLAAQGAALPSASNIGALAARAAPEVKPADISKLEADRTEASQLSLEQKQRALEEINQVMGAFAISVRFQIDPADQQVVIKVVDQESGKVIRQFPSEEVVRMSKALDNLKGMLFAQTV